jgi:NAD(P)-dependent dehydrogenase (short-subunit alcohol dehydrogenase family)
MSKISRPLEGRIALVTGATRGIGRAAAQALGAAGAHVFAVGRTQGALEELDDAIVAAGGHRPTLVPLDLAEADGVDVLGQAIFERHGRLDVLVHAAGMLGGLWPVAHVDPKLWDRIVSTNLTSAYRLIRSLEPLLRRAEAGRALFLTVGEGVRHRAFWGAYAATKSAVDALVRCWADEIEHTGVRAVLINPGAARTRMHAEAFPGVDPDTLTDPTEIGAMIVAYAAATDLGLPTEAVRFSDWKAAQNASPTASAAASRATS